MIKEIFEKIESGFFILEQRFLDHFPRAVRFCRYLGEEFYGPYMAVKRYMFSFFSWIQTGALALGIVARFFNSSLASALIGGLTGVGTTTLINQHTTQKQLKEINNSNAVLLNKVNQQVGLTTVVGRAVEEQMKQVKKTQEVLVTQLGVSQESFERHSSKHK